MTGSSNTDTFPNIDGSSNAERSSSVALLGGRLLHSDPAAGVAEMEFDAPHVLVQGAGVIQGGAVGAMLELAMTQAVSAALQAGQRCETAALDVAFVRAAPQGRYRAIARVDRQGGSLAFAQSRLVDADDPQRLIATAAATLTIESKGVGVGATTRSTIR